MNHHTNPPWYYLFGAVLVFGEAVRMATHAHSRLGRVAAWWMGAAGIFMLISAALAWRARREQGEADRVG